MLSVIKSYELGNDNMLRGEAGEEFPVESLVGTSFTAVLPGACTVLKGVSASEEELKKLTAGTIIIFSN